MLTLLCMGLLLVPVLPPLAEASHITRIVWPYGLDERWVPVIAGYKVVPDPLPCQHGTGAGDTLLATSFEGGLGPFSLAPADIGPLHSNNNQWHATTFAGKGSDTNHEGAGKLYFGTDRQGNYRSNFQLTQGSAVVSIDLPAGTKPWYAAFTTKWETEWLDGYDHMWVEAIPADGRIYILCTLNPEGRGDPSSSDEDSLAACSPYAVGICPNDARRLMNSGVPTQVADPAAPHWEARFVQIPPIWNGQRVLLRLTFDSADGVANTFLGWMVDDFQVRDGFDPTPTALPFVGELPAG